MSYFLTPDLSYEALMRLMGRVDKRSHAEIQQASLLYDNNVEPAVSVKMNTTDIQSRNRCWIPIALTSVIVDKIATSLYGRNVRRSTGDGTLDEILAPTWRDASRTLLRVSKVASLVKNDTVGVSIQYPGRVKYMDYGAGNSIPLLDPEDPHGRPLGVVHDYFSDTRDVGSQVEAALTGGDKTIKHVVEVITRHQRDASGNIVLPGIHILFEDGKRIRLADNGYNTLGDFLGCVFWRGADHPDDAHGRSDVIPLIKMLDGLNELLCTAGEKILWNIHSPVVTNMAFKPGSLRYAPGELWSISGVGTGEFFKRLESDPNVSPVLELVNTIITMIHETSRVPSVATGDLEHIGNLASGRAFEIAMIPLADLMHEKEAVAKEQEIELMAESVAMLAYYGYIEGLVQPSAYGDWEEPNTLAIANLMKNASVEFDKMVYPVDSGALISGTVSAVSAGLMSKREGVRTLHPEWSEQDIDGEISDIGEPSQDTVV